MALDERLARELQDAGRPGDPSGVYEELIRRRERRHIAHRIRTGALALVVIAGTAVGVYALSRTFASSGTQPAARPRETAPQPGPSPAAEDRSGLGFPLCQVSSVDGHFVTPDQTSTVLVATRKGDTGGCPAPEEAFNVVALDVDRDGVADTSFGPIACTLECRAFSAPDIDGDATDELLVVQDGGAVVGLRLYDVVEADGQTSIVPVDVADPGDPRGGFEAGRQASFLLGGDAFELYALRCGDVPEPDGPGVVATQAESLPHDAPNAEWHAHETTLVLRDDGLLHVVDDRDITEPVTDDPSGPSFRSGERLCGSNLGP